jgi:hypothetical protein
VTGTDADEAGTTLCDDVSAFLVVELDMKATEEARNGRSAAEGLAARY